MTAVEAGRGRAGGERPAATTQVLVLAGGLSAEREVSLQSGRGVVSALAEVGVDAGVADVGADLLDVVRRHAPDVVWPVLHGAGGEDGTLPQVLELLRVPFVGSPSGAARLAWDKTAAAEVAARAGAAVPPSVTLPQSLVRDVGPARLLPLVAERIPGPVVVKPVHGGSSLGVGVVHDPGDLPHAMVSALGHDSQCRVERFVPGTEVAVTVVDDGGGPVAAPAVEIAPDSGAYDYGSRYTAGATVFHCPARLPDDVAQRLLAQAVAVHVALGLGHLSRSDWIVDADGRAWFLEVNTSPGMTGTSLVPQALQEQGGAAAVYARLVAAAGASSAG
ncbi:D-alanine--D-alanine ligase family protein [Aquipuribacter sp. SD81]|uniref:D-alanine--D-alanine ligase family protein n=1 Tax=Aquipuribacter sp. SD81 TaxID=3127703 RepID=UPI00301AA53C